MVVLWLVCLLGRHDEEGNRCRQGAHQLEGAVRYLVERQEDGTQENRLPAGSGVSEGGFRFQEVK